MTHSLTSGAAFRSFLDYPTKFLWYETIFSQTNLLFIITLKQSSKAVLCLRSLRCRCCATLAQRVAAPQVIWEETGQVITCPILLQHRCWHIVRSEYVSVCVSACVSGTDSCLVGRVMRLRGWASLRDIAAGFLRASVWKQAALCSHKHVWTSSQSGANMAEEAKKLAAYAAVDNHVQVPRAAVSRHVNVW